MHYLLFAGYLDRIVARPTFNKTFTWYNAQVIYDKRNEVCLKLPGLNDVIYEKIREFVKVQHVKGEERKLIEKMRKMKVMVCGFDCGFNESY